MPELIEIGEGVTICDPLLSSLVWHCLLTHAALAGCYEPSPHSHAASTLLAIELRTHADGVRVRGWCPPSGRGDPALQGSSPKSSFAHSNDLPLSVFDIRL